MIWFFVALSLVLFLAVYVNLVRGRVAENLNLHVEVPPTGDPTMLPIVMTESQRVTLSINPTDRNGEPAPIQNAVWSTEFPDLVSLTPSEDGLSCVVTALGDTGDCEVAVTADADLGDGVIALEDVAFISIVDDMASGLNLSASTPEFV